MDAARFRGSFSGDEKDVFFINDGGRFFDAHALLGFNDVLDGRAVVPIDVNGDGRLDLAYRSLDGIRLISIEFRTTIGTSSLNSKQNHSVWLRAPRSSSSRMAAAYCGVSASMEVSTLSCHCAHTLVLAATSMLSMWKYGGQTADVLSSRRCDSAQAYRTLWTQRHCGKTRRPLAKRDPSGCCG